MTAGDGSTRQARGLRRGRSAGGGDEKFSDEDWEPGDGEAGEEAVGFVFVFDGKEDGGGADGVEGGCGEGCCRRARRLRPCLAWRKPQRSLAR